jgi:hypothetical protein
MNAHEIITLNGTTLRVPARLAANLPILTTAHAGGIATVKGYKPTTGYVVSPVVDIQFISRFSTERLYERRAAALKALTLADVIPFASKDKVLATLSVADLEAAFNARIGQETASLEKTLDGDRSDASREGHDRCYVGIVPGLKFHLETEKVDGIMVPVLTDGLPTAKSLMVGMLEIRRTYREEGQRKVVNSGIPVRVGNAIQQAFKKRTVSYRTLSLKPDNFDTLTLDSVAFTPADLAPEVAAVV